MSSYEAVKSAISRRVIYQHVDLIGQYGLDKVVEAIDLVAGGYHDYQLEEIGSSDVSCWVHDVKRVLSYQEVA